MNLRFKNSDSDYVLMVNRPELLARAEELGYDNAIIYDRDNIDSDDLAYIESQGKTLVCITYDSNKAADNDMGMQGYRIGRNFETRVFLMWLDLFQYAVHDENWNEIEVISTLEDALRIFPKKEELEKNLRSWGKIREIDHTNRCGNCHKPLRKGSKYCVYCGTRRGEGKFEPFINRIDVVYGPPIKMKYHCSDCGHIWVTAAVGGDNSNYCPMCGSTNISILRQKEYGFPKSPYSMMEFFEDEEDSPVSSDNADSSSADDKT
jgi:hypothetical protein